MRALVTGVTRGIGRSMVDHLVHVASESVFTILAPRVPRRGAQPRRGLEDGNRQ
jgi:NAD(P)-dependent dehydrogenase (short-subunit alcohol dehydrogenase family)